MNKACILNKYFFSSEALFIEVLIFLNAHEQHSWNMEEAFVASAFGCMGSLAVTIQIAEPFTIFVINEVRECIFIDPLKPA